MSAYEITKMFDEAGHTLTPLPGGKIKVTSPNGRPAPELLQLLTDNKLAVTAFISPNIACDQIWQAWQTLTNREKVLIPDSEMKRLREMPTETIPELKAWVAEWLMLIETTKERNQL